MLPTIIIIPLFNGARASQKQNVTSTFSRRDPRAVALLATSGFRTINVQNDAADVSSVFECSRQRYRIRGSDVGIAPPLPGRQKRPPAPQELSNSSEFFPSGRPLHFQMAGLSCDSIAKMGIYRPPRAKLRNSAREFRFYPVSGQLSVIYITNVKALPYG